MGPKRRGPRGPEERTAGLQGFLDEAEAEPTQKRRARPAATEDLDIDGAWNRH